MTNFAGRTIQMSKEELKAMADALWPEGHSATITAINITGTNAAYCTDERWHRSEDNETHKEWTERTKAMSFVIKHSHVYKCVSCGEKPSETE